MVDPIAQFRDALGRVPRVLLDSEDSRILTDAITSADVLETLVSVPRSVVVVGCTGVGKSHVVNMLTRSDSAQVGVLRPTTRSILMVGSSGPVPIGHDHEYAVASNAPDGFVFVDTPGFDVDREAVLAALATADLALIVVSPTRFGDATTRDLWEVSTIASSRAVVLNRMRGSDDDRAEMITAVKENFRVEQVAIVDENGTDESLVRVVDINVPRVELFDDRALIARTSGATAGLHIASAITAAADELGQLRATIEALAVPSIGGQMLSVRESWLATEQEIVVEVRRTVDRVDRMILDGTHGGIAGRVHDELELWNPTEFERGLADWNAEAAARFRQDATVRWRRSSTEHLLDQASWKVGVNPSVRVSRRVEKAMKPLLDEAGRDMHRKLVAVASLAVEQRIETWRAAVQDLGSFTPGDLFRASEALRVS